MFFRLAKQRSYDQNLQVLTTSPMEPAVFRTKAQINRFLKQQVSFLTPGEMKECQQEQIDPKDYVCAYEAAYEKNRQNFHEMFGTDCFKEGNCTAIPMSILMRQKNNPLTNIFTDKNIYVNPIKLIEYLKKTQPDFVYETDEEHDFAQLFSEKEIKKGALIVISLEKDFYDEQVQYDVPQRPDEMVRGHMLVCSRLATQQNGKIEPVCISFDDERLNYILSPRRQCGYVIDLPKIIQFKYQELQNLLCRRENVKDLKK